MKTARVTFRLDAPDRELADRLARYYGLVDRTALLRYLLRREGRRLKLDSDLPAATPRKSPPGRPKKNLENSEKMS